MNTTHLSTVDPIAEISAPQLNSCVARGRQLRSAAVIELTRQLYGLPAKCVEAYSRRLDRRASDLGGSCPQCA